VRTRNVARRTLGLTLLAIVSSACWATTQQHETLTQRVNQLETGLGQELRTEIGTAQTKVSELESVLDRATKLVTRTSADTGAQVETLQSQVAAQEGAIAELQHELARMQNQLAEQQADFEAKMKKLARKQGVDAPLDDAEIPADKEQHWQAATRAYESRDFATARGYYRAFVTRYHDDARADDAQLAVGRSYLMEERPATALGELRRVIQEWQQGDAVPAALLAMGDAFYRLHACTDARTALDALIRAHARSPQANDARQRLRDIQRAPAGYCQS
jgi:TolA-binding protein